LPTLFFKNYATCLRSASLQVPIISIFWWMLDTKNIVWHLLILLPPSITDALPVCALVRQMDKRHRWNYVCQIRTNIAISGIGTSRTPHRKMHNIDYSCAIALMFLNINYWWAILTPSQNKCHSHFSRSQTFLTTTNKYKKLFVFMIRN